MASINLSIKYRPIRIGFLVQDGSIDDLVKAAGINTLLWGGIYNPIIPVSTNSKFAEQLMNLFSVDVLFPTSHTKEIDDLIKKYPFLRAPAHYAENIFYEDWHTKKNIIAYLDSLNIVNYYWEKEFKHKPKEYKSNCALIRWEENDELKYLFQILFGYFPTGYNLKYNFENAFLKGLQSREIKISTNNPIPKNLAETISPIRLTASELIGYGGNWRGDGIYVGDENDFYDLLYFWNLRASGLFIEFLPKNKIKRFKEYIDTILEIFNNTPNRNPNIEDWINVYYRMPHSEAGNLVKELKSKKRLVFSHCNEIIWNGLNIKPADFYFGWENILASVDTSYNRYVVSVSLPEKKFIVDKNRNVEREHLIVSIEPISEFEVPEHTLKPPFIRQLNEFYSREIALDPWKVRIAKDGIAAIIESNDNSLFLYPIPHQALIQKIFELAGLKSEISQAGLITKRIIKKLEGVDGGRVFKISGVRRLFTKLNKNDFITRNQAKQIILRKIAFKEDELKSLLGETFNELVAKFFNFNEKKKEYFWKEGLKNKVVFSSDERIRNLYKGDFEKFENLYIEQRENAKLTTDDVFNFLLKKDFLRPGLELICNHCKLPNWISLQEIDDIWRCNYCGDDNKTSLQLKDRGDWKFRKSGLFAKDNNQEGAIPVILTLLVFLRIFDSSKFIYSPSLKLISENKSCEIDFCILQYQRGDKIQLGIGECKSEGGIIDQEDVDNLKFIWNKVKSLNIDCYLVFSKTAEKFEQSEIDLFKKAKEENIPIILLTNKEMEPYHPYWETPEVDNLPEKYALDMTGMSRNSVYLYLRD